MLTPSACTLFIITSVFLLFTWGAVCSVPLNLYLLHQLSVICVLEENLDYKKLYRDFAMSFDRFICDIHKNDKCLVNSALGTLLVASQWQTN